MSTNINISVGDNKLLEQARLQQSANREAQLEKEANQRLTREAEIERVNALAAQGKDANGNLITGTPFSQPQIERRPAANRRGECFIQVFPPTGLLAASPLLENVQPDYQASVRQWWQLQQRGIAETVGFGDISQPEFKYDKNPLIYAVGDSITMDPSVINTEAPVGIQLDSFASSRLLSSSFSPSNKQIKEILLTGSLQTPPLCDDFLTEGLARSYASVVQQVIVTGSNPSFSFGISVGVTGQSIALQGLADNFDVSPSSPVSYSIRVGPSGTSYVTINGQTIERSNTEIWSANQSFTLRCSFRCDIERSAMAVGKVPVPWPSVPESAGLIGNTKVIFRT